MGTSWGQKKGLELLGVFCPPWLGTRESKAIAISVLSFMLSLAVLLGLWPEESSFEWAMAFVISRYKMKHCSFYSHLCQ